MTRRGRARGRRSQPLRVRRRSCPLPGWLQRGLLTLCVMTTTAAARGAPGEVPDGVYGRFDGDLSLSVGGGAELALDPAHPRWLGSLALRYYSLVGVYTTYRESFDEDDPIRRGLSAGLLVEPLFLLRWTRAEGGASAFWDLVIDSLGVSAGAALLQPRGEDFFDPRGRGVELGLGLGVPLFAWAEGAWLRTRGLVRWRDDGSADTVLWLTLEWQSFFQSPLPRRMAARP